MFSLIVIPKAAPHKLRDAYTLIEIRVRENEKVPVVSIHSTEYMYIMLNVSNV